MGSSGSKAAANVVKNTAARTLPKHQNQIFPSTATSNTSNTSLENGTLLNTTHQQEQTQVNTKTIDNKQDQSTTTTHHHTNENNKSPPTATNEAQSEFERLRLKEIQENKLVQEHFKQIFMKEVQKKVDFKQVAETKTLLENREKSEIQDLLPFATRQSQGVSKLTVQDLIQLFVNVKSNPSKTEKIAKRFGLDEETCRDLLMHVTTPEYLVKNGRRYAAWVDDLIEFRKEEARRAQGQKELEPKASSKS